MEDKKLTFHADLAAKRSEAMKEIEVSGVADKPTSHRTKAIISMAALGYSVKEISRHLNLTTDRVYTLLRSGGAKKEIERIQNEFFFNDPQKMFKQMAPKAARTVNRLMLNPNEKGSTRLGAAGMILDRAYGKAAQPVQIETSAIKELFMAMDKSRNGTPEAIKQGDSGDIIEAEFRNVNNSEQSKPKDELDSWLDENF